MFNSCFEHLLSSPKVTFRLEDSVSSTVGETENNKNKQQHPHIAGTAKLKTPKNVKNSTNLRNSCKNVFCLFFTPKNIQCQTL